jgi:hypothetical protein
VIASPSLRSEIEVLLRNIGDTLGL